MLSEIKKDTGVGQDSLLALLTPEKRDHLLAPLANMKEVQTELSYLAPEKLVDREAIRGVLNHSREVYAEAEFLEKRFALGALLEYFDAFSTEEILHAAGIVQVAENETRHSFSLRSLFSKRK